MNSVFTTGFIKSLMGWLQSLINSLIGLIVGSEGGSLLTWLASHWKGLLIFLIIAGCAVNVMIYLIRWRPQWWWFAKKRMVIDDTILEPGKKRTAPRVKPSSIVPIHDRKKVPHGKAADDDDDFMTPKKKKR